MHAELKRLRDEVTGRDMTALTAVGGLIVRINGGIVIGSGSGWRFWFGGEIGALE